MSLWRQTAILGLYTLTPTHYGIGQTVGAVDLPIARDAATGFPVLPATGLKGVLRDVAEQNERVRDKIDDLFGPALGNGGEDTLTPGRLAFTEARLIAYPVRSLTRPFLHVTCPLVLDGLARTLRATGGDAVLKPEALSLPAAAGARVADPALKDQALVLEDLIYPAGEVVPDAAVRTVADLLAGLLPAAEEATRQRLMSGLVVVPDHDFSALMTSAVPVRARVQLTSGKTTDRYENPETGESETGNLWYEEMLPSDCLFAALIGERRVRPGGGRSGAKPGTLADFVAERDDFRVIQVGGNETVGQGVCLTSLRLGGDAS